MADAFNYLSLISAMNYPYNVQGLYSGYNPYSAAYLYGGSEGESSSFSNIFGSCVNAMMNSNVSLLSDLATSNNNVSASDKAQFIEDLEEATRDTCDCKSADLVKELYSAYLSNTTGYARNQLNQLVKAVTSETDSKTSEQVQSTGSTNKNNQELTAINYSIPTEEDIDNMITQSMSMPISF